MIGIDIVAVRRFKNKKNHFLNKVFSKKELNESKYNFKKLAGKWAAKEAAFKAGINYINHDIEIITKQSRPQIFIKGIRSNAMVSISHDNEYATAIVFNEKS